MTLDQMSHAEVLNWANQAYQSQNARFMTEVVNTPDEQVAREFLIVPELVSRLKTTVAEVQAQIAAQSRKAVTR